MRIWQKGGKGFSSCFFFRERGSRTERREVWCWICLEKEGMKVFGFGCWFSFFFFSRKGRAEKRAVMGFSSARRESRERERGGRNGGDCNRIFRGPA